MKARILRPEEWATLDVPQMPPLVPYVSPENIAIVVVEDDAGKVVACMTVLRTTHFEGVWIDPEHRNAGVTRALLRLAVALARGRNEEWVFAGSADERMRGVLGKLGAVHVPMETFVLPVGGDQCRPQ